MHMEMHVHASDRSSCSDIAPVRLVRDAVCKGCQGPVITGHHRFSDMERLMVRSMKLTGRGIVP